MPFNFGPTEMIFVMVVLLLVFGAKRLPELGSGLGKGIREFRRSMKEINSEIERSDDTDRITAPKPRQTVAPPAEPQTADEPRS
jgi:sec-independent protein translocase protein TatA